ncbi:4-phosphopantoate--beta-alanine ligase [Methanolobus halotolerans]|uniref:4-phosphopantoate--beta-alanine ligase n=1 Tax=Methanolobus halotolerans TaxID=2052935 RepID=A0A4E0Q285_9EURY|nr:4-phosphopantoate--beta-alanine ligase [Methanolobus halotolerans]TGC11349.1 phosphopantothenate/pantothenate synthetase [Methanolobus halotolerans]
MTEISREHPRYESLITREKIVEGVRIGITSKQGLVAQGRGEAFDYLIGERTTESAAFAERAAVAHMLLATKLIISVNGNTAALVPENLVALADVTGATLEVNLFHRSDARIHKIAEHLKSRGAGKVLGCKGDKRLDLSHDRAIVDEEGIFNADVVLVPLEDGDRCQKLVEMGKTVISIDLNPLSRTSLSSTVSIIDNVTRALQNMTQFAKDMKHDSRQSLRDVIVSYDNNKVISDALYAIQERLKLQAGERGIQWI